MMLFTKTAACTSRAHCAYCRDTGEAGKRWRRVALKPFKPPDDGPDFACPYGVGWDEGGEAQVVPGRGQEPPPNLLPENQFKGGCCG